MSRLALLSAILCMLLVSTGRAALEDYYYNNVEIKHELDSLAALYPDWIKVDSIGHSYELEEPIWSAKISDNVHVDEDEPAFWVNGACHSEEILGINITMAFIRELVALGSIGHPNWGPIIQSMEIHCVPSNNPDGMSIVMSELDATYRKNLHSFPMGTVRFSRASAMTVAVWTLTAIIRPGSSMATGFGRRTATPSSTTISAGLIRFPSRSAAALRIRPNASALWLPSRITAHAPPRITKSSFTRGNGPRAAPALQPITT